MKKIALFLVIALLVMSVVPLTVGAECERIFENDPINVPKANPTIDGKIDATEGWSKVAYLNEDTAGYFYGQNQLTSTVDFYFAFNDDGLYFGAIYNEYHAAYTVRFYNEKGESIYNRSYIDPNATEYSSENYPEKTPDGTVIEAAIQPPAYDHIIPENGTNAYWYSTGGNTTVYSEGDDTLDSVNGWDGDVVALMLDPNGVFNAAELYGDKDYTPQYNFGIFNEGGKDVVKVKTSRVEGKDITDVCKTAGVYTNESITYEVFIPWTQIVDDMNEMAQKFSLDHTFTVDEMIASGAVHRASVTLMDRFYDEEAGYVDSWGRYITVCETCDDGIPGGCVGPVIKGMGLKLIMPGDASNGSTGDTDANGVAVTDANGNTATGSNGGSTTTKAANTNKGGNGGSSANTFDAGIVVMVALGVVAIVGICVVSKKRTNK